MTMIVSFSEVFKWQTCQRQYYYRFNLGFAPLEETDPMVKGTLGHKLLEVFYTAMREGHPKEEAINITRDAAKKLMSKDQLIFNLITAWTLVDNYIRDTEFTSEAIIIENRFLLPASFLSDDPIFSDVQIGFTPDVVLQRPSGKIDIKDAKFVGRAWSKRKINRFPQLKLYQIFLSHMDYDISRTILQFFNTTTAKITEVPYTLEGDEEKILTRDFMRGVKDVVEYRLQSEEERELAPRTMNYTACQYCSFEFVCGLEAEGKDASKTLAVEFKQSDYDYNK